MLDECSLGEDTLYTLVRSISVGATIMEDIFSTGPQKAPNGDFTIEGYNAMIESFSPAPTADVIIIRLYNGIQSCASLDVSLKALLMLYLENLSLDQTFRRGTVVNTDILSHFDPNKSFPNSNEDQDMLELEHRFSNIRVGRRPEAQRRSQNITTIKSLQRNHPGLERKAAVYVRARLSAFMETETGLITKTRIPGLLSRLYDFEDRQAQPNYGRSFEEQLRQGFCEVDVNVIARSTKPHAAGGRLAKTRTGVRNGRGRVNKGMLKGNLRPPKSETQGKADGMEVELPSGMRLNKNGKIVKVKSKIDKQRARRRQASERRKARAYEEKVVKGMVGQQYEAPVEKEKDLVVRSSSIRTG